MDAHPECDAVFCNQAVIDGAGNLDAAETERVMAQYGRDELPFGVVPREKNVMLFEKNAIPLEACVLRRQAWRKWGPFRAQAQGALDLDLFTRMLAGGATFGFVPQALTQFRFHDEAYTARKREEHLRGMVWSIQSIHAEKLMRNKAGGHRRWQVWSGFLFFAYQWSLPRRLKLWSPATSTTV